MMNKLFILVLIAGFLPVPVFAEGLKLAPFKIDVADIVEWEIERDNLSVSFNEEKAKELCSITRSNVAKRIEFYFEDALLFAPQVNEPICSGRITFFKFEQQDEMIKTLQERGKGAP